MHGSLPWFRAAVQQDRDAIELAHQAREREAGAIAPEAPGSDADGYVDPKQWAREIFSEGLMPAVRTSPVVFRAFLRWFNLLATPDALINDGEVIGAALQSYQDREQRPPEPALGPKLRADFLAALDAAAATQ